MEPVINMIVFGKNGMLGKYIYDYFKGKQGYNVAGFTRNEMEINEELNELKIKQIIEDKIKTDNKRTVIINCIGLTNKVQGNFTLVNSKFPEMINNVSLENDWLFIQPSTDCVFSGKKIGGKTELDIPDACDEYGKSKHQGEYGMVIRLSIIGEDLRHGRGLYEYVRNTQTIKGFSNHMWNGVSCLEYAKIIEQLLRKNIIWNGVRHIAPSYIVSKDELIRTIVKVNGWDKIIETVSDLNINDKQLDTIYNTDIYINDLETQLKELLTI